MSGVGQSQRAQVYLYVVVKCPLLYYRGPTVTHYKILSLVTMTNGDSPENHSASLLTLSTTPTMTGWKSFSLRIEVFFLSVLSYNPTV